MIGNLAKVPEAKRGAVRNNGGGHYNHTLFWDLMTPGGPAAPDGKLEAAISSAFGGFDAFKEQFSKACTTRFGSGWGWLVRGSDGELVIESTPNQDSPVMEGKHVVLGCDVWEHAYYLKYQNRRPDYLAAWWNVVNWSRVAALRRRNDRHLRQAVATADRVAGARFHPALHGGQRRDALVVSWRQECAAGVLSLAFTGTCTKEMCAFTDDFSQFASRDTVVLPISVDSTDTLKEYQAKYHMSFELLSDFKRDVSRLYGVLNDSSTPIKGVLRRRQAGHTADGSGAGRRRTASDARTLNCWRSWRNWVDALLRLPSPTFTNDRQRLPIMLLLGRLLPFPGSTPRPRARRAAVRGK